jgi:hypothetical protein
MHNEAQRLSVAKKEMEVVTFKYDKVTQKSKVWNLPVSSSRSSSLGSDGDVIVRSCIHGRKFIFFDEPMVDLRFKKILIRRNRFRSLKK